MSNNKVPKTRLQLTYKLLQTNPGDVTENELFEILNYIIETPMDILRQKTARTRIMKVLSSEDHWKNYVPKSIKPKVVDFLINLAVLDAQTDFYTFVKLIAECVIPNTFRDGRHLQVICEHLQHLYNSYVGYEEDPTNKAGRLQVFLPPRSMKSVLCSILFPAWILGRNPKYRILLIGNNTQNAIDNFGRPSLKVLGITHSAISFTKV